MESGKRNQKGWRARFTGLIRVSVPYAFALSGLALGVGGIVENEPVVGACGAVAGVTAALVQLWRVRFYRDQAEALRERLRTHRSESEQVTAQLRQTVSSLQTELWQHRMVALATPAFGLQMSALNAAAADKNSAVEALAGPAGSANPAEPKEPTGLNEPTGPKEPAGPSEPFAQAS